MVMMLDMNMFYIQGDTVILKFNILHGDPPSKTHTMSCILGMDLVVAPWHADPHLQFNSITLTQNMPSTNFQVYNLYTKMASFSCDLFLNYRSADRQACIV